MELLTTIAYRHHNRHFDIHVYRDTNNDRLVMEPVETSAGKKENVSHLKAYVHMKGVFNLPAGDYPGYAEALAAVKDSLQVFLNPTLS